MTKPAEKELILSIFLPTRGFVFVLFETPSFMAIDWGTRETRSVGKRQRGLDAIGCLLEKYQPDIVLIEEWRVRHSIRNERVRRLYRGIETRAKKLGIEVCPYSRDEVIECFVGFGARTKHQRAVTISKLMPAFAYKVPPPRKLWKTEHPRMAVFEASALIITHIHRTK